MSKKKEFTKMKIKNSQILPSNDFQSKDIQELLKQLDILYSENYQLKEALSDLEKDLKDKDQSIEESQKIITKLKDEYSKVIKDFQQMEKSYNDLLDEVNQNSLEMQYAQKNKSLLNALQKKNDSLSNEKNNLHKENAMMRKKILSCGSISLKNEKDIKSKDLLIENLQTKNKNLIKMVKERENIIVEHTKKIKELNDVINNKNEELKIMMNISKEINKENKINVKILTKQAVKTIKAIQGNKNRNFSVDYNSKISLSNNNKNTLEDFESIFKNNKAIFCLEDALNGVMYIPDNLQNVSKEFLIDMNLKTELIKSELFSGIIRETQFINFIQKILEKMHLRDNKGILNLFHKILELKKKYLNIIKENYKMKKVLSKINNKDIFNIQKIKDNVNKNNKIIKSKFIEKQKEIQNLKNEIKVLNNILITNSIQNTSTIHTSKHMSTNNCKKRVKSIGEIISLPTWNTLSSSEGPDINVANIDKTPREISNIHTNIKTNRIKKKIYKRTIGKNKIINKNYNNNQFEKENNILLYHNNSIEINRPFNIDNDKSEDLIFFNDNNNSLKSEHKNKYNYKKDIFNLQKEINNILMRSYPDKNSINIIDSKNKTPKNKTLYMKIGNQLINGKNKKVIFSDRTHEKTNSISFATSPENNIIDNRTKNIKKHKVNCIFNSDFFINLFLKLNNIFDVFELNKYRQIYNLSNINNIYLSFKQICNQLKNKTDETNYKINKSHVLTKNNFTEAINIQNERKDFIDNSFKYFNEKIISLKKFEFESINMNEYIKNYLISQEITIQIMYKMGKKYIKFEPIEKLFNLFEDCLSYRINEMNENIIFNRKLLIKLFKNQINCLFLSFEYNFN